MRVAVLLTAIMLLAGSIGATPIYLDTFDFTNQTLAIAGAPVVQTRTQTVTVPEALSGARTFFLQRLSGLTGIRASAGVDNGGWLTFSSDANATGTLDVTWDFGGGIDIFQYGFIDILAGSDLGQSASITVYSGATYDHRSEKQFFLPAGSVGAMQAFVLPLNTFTAGGLGAADLTQVTRIRLSIDGTNSSDAAVDFVAFSIPEPVTLLMIATGLLSLGVLRYRIKRR